MAVNKGEIGIYGVLRRDGGDGVLAKTDQIKDTNLNKTQEQLNQEVVNNIASKVDKVEGKSLVSDTDITKLSELPSNSDLNNKLDDKLSKLSVEDTVTKDSPNPVSSAAISTYVDNAASAIKAGVANGNWLPVKEGDGMLSVVIGYGTAEGPYSIAEGVYCTSMGEASHAEGYLSFAVGAYSHAQGVYNYADPTFIDVVGIGDYYQEDSFRKNASVIYVKRNKAGFIDHSDPKNGYSYLLGVGGYQGRKITEGMKSVQEVIADLETNLTNKVDNVEGKQLSTNDYTTADQNKVAESINESTANTLINTAIGKLTKANVGLDNVDNTADANKEVLSATKLKTAHTFWGQPFDGTANVSGDIVGIGKGTTAKLDIQKIAAPGEVDYIHMFVTEAQRPLVLQNGYGNVGIGVVAPVEKFEVDGNIKLTGSVKNVTEIYTTDGSKYAEPCTEDDIKALFV